MIGSGRGGTALRSEQRHRQRYRRGATAGHHCLYRRATGGGTAWRWRFIAIVYR